MLIIVLQRRKLFTELVATRTTDKFTDADLESAKRKIAQVAFTLDESKRELDVSTAAVLYSFGP
jgi:hypothetical protein